MKKGILYFFLGGFMTLALILTWEYIRPFHLSKSDQIMFLLQSKYQHPLNIDSLEEVYIQSILEDLDPHSQFLNQIQVAKTRETIQGHFAGIGVAFTWIGDTVVITNLMKDMYAQKAGLQKGDRIVYVDGMHAIDSLQNSEKISNRIKGEVDTEVEIGVFRKNQGLINISVKRGYVEIPSLSVEANVDSNTYLTKLDFFGERTFSELENALDKIPSHEEKTLIIDLRDNPGGLMNQTIQIANLFLEKGDTIIRVQDRKTSQPIVAKQKPKYRFKKLYVLVNNQSASASEILSIALKENKKATIVGENTFGKGLIQTEFKLRGGEILRLTTAQYTSPKGQAIQRKYADKSAEQYYFQKTDSTNRFGVQPDMPIPPINPTFKKINDSTYGIILEEIMHFADRQHWAMKRTDLENLDLKKASKNWSKISLDLNLETRKFLEKELINLLATYTLEEKEYATHFVNQDPDINWLKKQITQ